MTTTTESTTAAVELATFLANLRYEDLPADVVSGACRAVIDTLAAGIFGSTVPEGQLAAKAARRLDSSTTVSVWGTDMRAGAAIGALVNGTAAHARELDDVGGSGHPGAVVVPAALAIAEMQGNISGPELLTAVVAGYELAFRVTESIGGYAAHTTRGWHATSTCGGFAAAAAAGKLLQLDAAQLTSTLGIAGSYTGGTWAFLVDGAMSKRLHPGKAAESGVVAAVLAQEGFTGPAFIFEAQWGGFWGTYANDGQNPTALTEGLGQRYRILQSGMKPYASCRGVHGAIDALIELRQAHRFVADDVERITVSAHPRRVQMVGGRTIQSVLDAQMSLPYGLAVLLVTEDASVRQYRPERLHDPVVQAMLQRVTMVADPTIPSEQMPTVEVQLRDGRTYATHVAVPLGDPEKPLSNDDLNGKFRSLVPEVLPATQAEALLDLLWNLDRQESLDKLWPLLTQTAKASP